MVFFYALNYNYSIYALYLTVPDQPAVKIV